MPNAPPSCCSDAAAGIFERKRLGETQDALIVAACLVEVADAKGDRGQPGERKLAGLRGRGLRRQTNGHDGQEHCSQSTS